MENSQENISIGARELTRNQVKMIVPTYEYMLIQIDEIRKQAKDANNVNESNKKTVKEYNNTIGLFGQRGTGKTSTLYTLIKDLREDYNKNINIVLPTIKPDNYGEHTKILGSILGLLKKELESIEIEIEKNGNGKTELCEFFNDCRFKKNNRLSIEYNELLEYYCYKEEEYRKLLTQNYIDMETYKKKYSYILNPDYEFERKLKKFIDIFVEVKKKVIKKDNKEVEEPLLFIIIDDIDLKTSKCKELVDSVMQYTCHKNVVCILSGDYEILQESVTISLLEGEDFTKTPFSIVKTDVKKIFESDMSLVERKKYLAKEYLKKVLPPALRHNVVKWTNENIHSFSVILDNEKTIYFYDKLIELLGEESLFCNKVLEEDKITGEECEKRIYPKTAYGIFDKTPRGLINIIYYLSKLNKNIFDLNNLKEKFEFVKSLIDTIIASSTNLIDNKRNFYDESLIWGADIYSSKINFTDVEKSIYNLLYKINEDKRLKDVGAYEDIINEFYLLFFVKELFEKDRINIERYDETKKAIIKLMDEVRIKDLKENSIINEIKENLDFKFVSFFYDYLDKYVSEKNKRSIEDEDIFKILYNILSVEEVGKKIIVDWYKMKYEDDKINKMKVILDFLDMFSRKKDEHKKIKRLYIDIIAPINSRCKNLVLSLNSTINYNVSNSKKLNEFVYEKTDFEQVILPLILNTISDAISEEKVIDKEQEKDNLYDNFVTLLYKDVLVDNINIGKKLIERRYIDRSHNIANEIIRKICISDITEIVGGGTAKRGTAINYYINIYEIIKDFNEFISSISNYNGNSLVSKIAKRTYIEDSHYISLSNFLFLIRALYYIGYESWAYNGVLECRNIREKLINNSVIYEKVLQNHENDFGDVLEDAKYESFIDLKDKNIIYIYNKYCEKYYKEKLDYENLESKKVKMKQLLKTAYEEVQKDINNQLAVIGVDAESYFSEIENGES